MSGLREICWSKVMNDLEAKKNRYMQDTLPIRMGGIAANLSRVGSFVKFAEGKVAVSGLIEESKYFIEWTAAEFDLETTVELVDIQRKLVRWQNSLDKVWDDEAKRAELGFDARNISERLLARSGLLQQ